MRRPIFQCCVLVSLLVTRLLFGEVAHATPHQMMVTGVDMVAEPHVCPERATPANPASNQAGHSHGSSYADLSSAADVPAASADGYLDAARAAFDANPGSERNVADDAVSDSPGCCGGGDCECLCVHISVATAPGLSVNLVLAAQISIACGTTGLIQSRPSILFRPPAV